MIKNNNEHSFKSNEQIIEEILLSNKTNKAMKCGVSFSLFDDDEEINEEKVLFLLE